MIRGIKREPLLISDEQDREVRQVVKLLESRHSHEEILFIMYKVLTKEMEDGKDEMYFKRYGDKASEAECNLALRISKLRYVRSLLASIE
jgi:hypothetical protein